MGADLRDRRHFSVTFSKPTSTREQDGEDWATSREFIRSNSLVGGIDVVGKENGFSAYRVHKPRRVTIGLEDGHRGQLMGDIVAGGYQIR